MSKGRANQEPAKDRFFKRAQPHQKANKSFRPTNQSTATSERYQRKDVQESQQSAPRNDKKPFDKKTYRLKKYSNKYKLEQWEENRRKSVLKKYYKDLKNDPQHGKYKPFNFDEAAHGGSSEDEDHQEDKESEDRPAVTETDGATVEEHQRLNFVMHPDLMEKFRKEEKTKSQPFWKARQELNRLREDKKKKKEAAEKAKEERASALAVYKQNKADKFKKLSKKTRKGQPLMKDRMQMLLENIQKSTNTR